MHLFESIRRPRAASSRRTPTTTTVQRPSSPTASSTRLPLTNLNTTSSQSSKASTESLGGASPGGGSKSRLGRSRDEPVVISKATGTKTGRSERSNASRNVRDGSPAAMPMAGQSSSQRSTYGSHPDLYTHNALNSFSFGVASSSQPSSRPIDPLSLRDDADSDEFRFKADTTPRPSLAGPSIHNLPLQPAPMLVALATALPPSPKPRHSPQRRRRTSNASTNTFGTSSASASVTSLSSNALGGSVTTPHTSNEFGSDDEMAEHRHPFPVNREGYMSTSDGEDDEAFDDDYEDHSEPDIEIGLGIPGDPDRLTTFNNASRESLRSAFSRKGSIAVPIPAPSIFDGRDREDSIATLRRPSRSLEDFKSDSLTRANMDAERNGEDRPVPEAPTSMPESDVDWRDLRRRSIQKEQDRAKEKQTGDAPSSSVPVITHNALDGFDSTWYNNHSGITDYNVEEGDIVGNYTGPRSSDRAFRRGSSSTTESGGRRLSTTSTNSDPFTKKLTEWGEADYITEKARWTFTREKQEDLQELRRRNEQERISTSDMFQPRHSFSTLSSMIGSSAGFQDTIAPFREKERTRSVKEKEKGKEPWRGMAIDAEEWWESGTNGRYRVIRKSMSSNDPGKPPQQRLNVSHHRTPYNNFKGSVKREHSDGPTSTIHKHSKAIGFSISRHYRPKPSSSVMGFGRHSTSSRITVVPGAGMDKKKPSSMILLAARKVQEAYTSTTTTRKLESHGFLSENGRQSSRDRERLDKLAREERDREKRQAEEEKQKEKQLKRQEARKNKELRKGKTQSRQDESTIASSSESSVGSITGESASTHSSSNAASSSHKRPSVDYSIMSHATSSSDRTIVRAKRLIDEDPLYDEEDEDVGIRRKLPSRTPHTETYATLPTETLENLTNPPHWKLGKNDLSHRGITPYNPPWAVGEVKVPNDRKGIVEDLNSSFQDVGLLPAVDEMKSSNGSHKRHRPLKSNSNSKTASRHALETPNVFHSFSAELLYMLLPLWPGETDPISALKFPFRFPPIPVESRRYLLVYYRPDALPEPPDQKGGSKKRSRPSPTSSRDSMNKGGEKSVLYDKYRICARVVSYSDIKGSGVRSPDAGLSVIGTLKEAYETMPMSAANDDFQVIGSSVGRDKGVEFIPEGLEKLELVVRKHDPTAVEEEKEEEDSRYSIKSIEEQDERKDYIFELTPIGRAVVEMVWLGAMALTSFGPGP